MVSVIFLSHFFVMNLRLWKLQQKKKHLQLIRMLENPTHALVGVHARQQNSDNLKPHKESS